MRTHAQIIHNSRIKGSLENRARDLPYLYTRDAQKAASSLCAPARDYILARFYIHI